VKRSNAQLGPGQGFNHWNEDSLGVVKLRAFGDAHRYEFKANVVCTTCNSGWMNELEQQVMPILPTLMNGDNRVLSPIEQRSVVRLDRVEGDGRRAPESTNRTALLLSG